MDLASIDPGSTPDFTGKKRDGEDELFKNGDEFAELQEKSDRKSVV